MKLRSYGSLLSLLAFIIFAISLLLIQNQERSVFTSDTIHFYSGGSSKHSQEDDIKNIDISQDVKTLSGDIKGLEIKKNLLWTPRTLSGIHYQFGSGNPQEVDKNIEELRALYLNCVNSTNASCRDQIPYYEQLSDTYDENLNPVYTGHISRVTPEIEYLVYQFLSNPIIQESSEKCGSYFWTFQQAYDVYGFGVRDLYIATEDYGLPKWWNPYNIDINDYIRIQPRTGRKDLNLTLISTLNTQIQTPSESVGGQYYTNIKLTECLKSTNLLTPLQGHVQYYYETLRKMWYDV